MVLLVCRTCPRYDPHRRGQFSRDLTQALRGGDHVAVRYVQCLGGCPEDGVAAVDGPGKARVRFTGLDPEHAELLARAASAHHSSATGAPEEWEVPVGLHVSAVTPKRQAGLRDVVVPFTDELRGRLDGHS